MAFFPATPKYGKNIYGDDVPKRDKKGKHVWTKSVDTTNKGSSKRKALQNRLKGIKGFGEGNPKKD